MDGWRFYLDFQYLAYVPNEDGKRQARVQITQELAPTDAPSWLGVTRYDNRWQLHSSGVAMLGWHGLQTGTTEEDSIRMVYFYDRSDGDSNLVFRPFADGIANVELKDTNDWSVMGQHTCSGLNYLNGGLCFPPPGGLLTLSPIVSVEVQCAID